MRSAARGPQAKGRYSSLVSYRLRWLLAVVTGIPHLVRYLRAAGRDPHSADTRALDLRMLQRFYSRLAGSPVHRAAYAGDIDKLNRLFARGADLNERNPHGQPPLHAAALVGQPQAAKWLIEHGADVNARDHRGKTPLMLAARFEQAEVLEILLAAGADKDLTDADGRSALDWALAEGKAKSVEVLRERSGSA